MSERSPLKEQAEAHLRKALEADSLETKNYHIRSAMQFEECMEAADGSDHVQAD